MGQGNETEITLLVARASAGDRQAFDQLVAPWFARLLLRGRKKLGNDDDAYEVVQEAFIGLWEYLPKVEDPRRFPGLVSRIFLTQLNLFLRRRMGRAEVEARVPTGERRAAPSQAPTAEESIGESDRARWAWSKVAALEETQKKVAELHWKEGLGPGEIAQELDLPEEKVAYLIRRVRDVIVAARKKERVA